MKKRFWKIIHNGTDEYRIKIRQKRRQRSSLLVRGDIMDAWMIVRFTPMEELIWSSPGGLIVLRRVSAVHCVHYIGEKDCRARFATGAI